MPTLTALALDDAEQEMQREVHRFVSDVLPLARTRAFVDGMTEFDGNAWRRLATELGATGLVVSSARGGMGLGPIAAGLVAQELGRTLAPSPFLPTVAMATYLLAASTDQRAEELTSAVVDDSATIRVGTSGVTDNDTVHAQFDDGAWRLTGTLDLVPTVGGETATLAAVTLPDGTVALFELVPGTYESVDLVNNDLTRPMHRVALEQTSAHRLAAESADLRRAMDIAAILLSAESLGAAEACLEMTVDYATERIQFGQAIGAFQYVKHACADLLMNVEGLRSLVMHALRVAANGPDGEVAQAASMAKRHADSVLWDVSRQAIQLHGGIGFTWEHDCHLYLRRAMGNRQLLGTSAWHGKRLETSIGLSAG